MKMTYNYSEILNIKKRLCSLVDELQKVPSTTNISELAQNLEEQLHHYDSVLKGLGNTAGVITNYELCQGFYQTELLLGEIEKILK